jgi:spermidine synthase
VDNFFPSRKNVDAPSATKNPEQFNILIVFSFVFFSGFASLATEIIGPRLFASLFGYTTEIWAAIISVTLLGISIGYYLGGRVPRHRIRQILPIVLTVNAIWLLGISWLIWSVPTALLQFGFISVLLVAGVAFLVPAMLFSFASPMSITMMSENRSPEWIARMVGNILAIGTMGSVLGALLAAFYLIPWVGLSASLRFFAIGSTLFAIYFSRKYRPVALLILGLCMIAPQPTFHWISDLTLLEQREGYYQTIRVYTDGVSSVQMHLGPTYETAVSLTTGEPIFPYANKMVELAGDAADKNILIIGGAGHSIARVLEKRGARVTEVEIDPFVVQLSDTYFGAIQGKVVVEDGRTYVDQAAANQFDYVMLDAFNGVNYIPPQLTTREFFTNVKRILKPGGRLFINLIAVPSGPRSDLFRAFSTTVSTVFQDVRVSETDGDTIRNIMVVASQNEITDLQYDEAPKDGIVLTDDLNPIEIFLDRVDTGQIDDRRILE